MPRDPEIDKILRPTGKAPAAAPTPSDTDEEGGMLDVGKGAAKSLAGTAVALPRLANWGISHIPRVGSRMSSSLADLAEKVPGVQSLEGFADSPNKTWGESLGYWGGEAAQLFGPSMLAKGAEAANAARAVDVGEMFTAGKGAAAPAAGKAAAVAAPEAAPFVSTGNKEFDEMIRAHRAAQGAGAAETGQSIKASRELLAGQKASEEAPGLGLRPLDADPMARRRNTLVGGALKGGVAGAVMDPQDPGSGFMSGAALGGATPALAALARSRAGQYLSGLLARGVSAEIVFRIGESMGIPKWAIMTLGAPHFIRGWHSPVARMIDRAGRAAGRGLSRLDTVPSRYPGGAAGAAAQGIEDDGGD